MKRDPSVPRLLPFSASRREPDVCSDGDAARSWHLADVTLPSAQHGVNGPSLSARYNRLKPQLGHSVGTGLMTEGGRKRNDSFQAGNSGKLPFAGRRPADLFRPARLVDEPDLIAFRGAEVADRVVAVALVEDEDRRLLRCHRDTRRQCRRRVVSAPA